MDVNAKRGYIVQSLRSQNGSPETMNLKKIELTGPHKNMVLIKPIYSLIMPDDFLKSEYGAIGSAFIGIIVELGDDVFEFTEGELVLCAYSLEGASQELQSIQAQNVISLDCSLKRAKSVLASSRSMLCGIAMDSKIKKSKGNKIKRILVDNGNGLIAKLVASQLMVLGYEIYTFFGEDHRKPSESLKDDYILHSFDEIRSLIANKKLDKFDAVITMNKEYDHFLEYIKSGGDIFLHHCNGNPVVKVAAMNQKGISYNYINIEQQIAEDESIKAKFFSTVIDTEYSDGVEDMIQYAEFNVSNFLEYTKRGNVIQDTIIVDLNEL